MLTDWTLIGNDPRTIQLASAHLTCFQLRDDGSIWFLEGGPPFDWINVIVLEHPVRIFGMPNDLCRLDDDGTLLRKPFLFSGSDGGGFWEQIDENPATVDLTGIGGNGEGDTAPVLFQRHADGSVYSYDGANWGVLDQNPTTVKIVQDDLGVIQLRRDGTILRHHDLLDGWVVIDANPATIDIAASFTSLYQMRSGGTILRATGGPIISDVPITGWEVIDDDPGTTSSRPTKPARGCSRCAPTRRSTCSPARPCSRAPPNPICPGPGRSSPRPHAAPLVLPLFVYAAGARIGEQRFVDPIR
ncbi:hypothetical protein [Nocardia sp. NPDC051981]|uniref:hypothetical protein n=1 Tax=Nocardia sp. NPDC051981 TaxID=3155417 RepID=UPI00343212AA